MGLLSANALSVVRPELAVLSSTDCLRGFESASIWCCAVVLSFRTATPSGPAQAEVSKWNSDFCVHFQSHSLGRLVAFINSACNIDSCPYKVNLLCSSDPAIDDRLGRVALFFASVFAIPGSR